MCCGSCLMRVTVVRLRVRDASNDLMQCHDVLPG